MNKLIVVVAVFAASFCCVGGFFVWFVANPDKVAEIEQQTKQRQTEQKKQSERERTQREKQLAEEREKYDGRTIEEWNQRTRITTDEESGIVYNLTLTNLKQAAARPDTVKLVGGHRVTPLGCELSETPRYQSHMCKGRVAFKNPLGVEDEETYTLYFRKYEDGEIKVAVVEIGGKTIFDIDAKRN